MTIKKGLSWLISGLLIVLILFTLNMVITTKINGGKTTLLGNQLMVVLSGSMSPTFDTGSVVAVKPVRFEDIKKGDIITFKDVDGKTVTHRVLEKQNLNLITKGDANDSKDSQQVTSDRVIGIVNYSVPYFGYFVEFTKSKTGMLVFLIIPGVYLIISQFWGLFKLLTAEEVENSNTDTTA